MKIITYNVGHGMYSLKYIKGKMVDKKTIINNIKGSLKLIKQLDPDIALLQETGEINIHTHFINHNKRLYIKKYDNIYLSNRRIPLLIDIGNTILIKKEIKNNYEKIISNYKLHGFFNNLFCQNKGSIKLILK